MRWQWCWHWVHTGCQSFEPLYLQTREKISKDVLCSPNMACPEQNVVLQIYEHQCAQQPEQFRIFRCLFVNNINNAFIVSEEKHSPVFQLLRPNAEASDNGKKLKKANTVLCLGLWPPAICPIFTKMRP